MKVQISKVDPYGGYKLEQKKSGQEEASFWVDGQSSRDANIPGNSQKRNREENHHKGQKDSHTKSNDDSHNMSREDSLKSEDIGGKTITEHKSINLVI